MMITARNADDSQPDIRALPHHFQTSIGFLLNKAAQIMFDEFESGLRPFGLSAREFGVLLFIDANGGQSQQQIGASLRIDRTTMVTIIDNLERAGYVVRVRDPQDRRRYAVTLTERGHEQMCSELAAIDREVTDRFLKGVSESDRKYLVGLLATLVNNAERLSSAGRHRTR
jgi:DNA-binding MarR family transcriptional regulator